MMPDLVFKRDVEDSLNSNRTDKPLSARMGQTLDKTKVDKKDALTEEDLEEILK